MAFEWTEAQQQAWLAERISPIAQLIKTIPEDLCCVMQTFHGNEDARVDKETASLSLSPEAQKRIRFATGADACVFALGEDDVYIVPREKIDMSSLEG